MCRLDSFPPTSFQIHSTHIPHISVIFRRFFRWK
nr:MAG TPA: hypothetical protein [Caudoviricetes sp.]